MNGLRKDGKYTQCKCYSTIKNSNSVICDNMIKLEIIILSEMSKAQERQVPVHDLTHMWNHTCSSHRS
jgi:hypothetical protein